MRISELQAHCATEAKKLESPLASLNPGIYSKEERTQRCAEEFFELMQAFDVPKEMLLNAIAYVYARPKGTPEAEVGGTVTTLALLCQSQGIDLEAAVVEDVNYFASNLEKIAKKRLRKPNFNDDFNGATPTIKPE